MKYLLKMGVACLLLSSCRTVKIDEDNFAFKSFDDTTIDQSVDLREYTSPNSRSGQDSERVVIFCASGGGSRAAAFCTGVMLELEKVIDKPEADSPINSQRNALNEIDYFSTVSGGGWGVSSFIAYKYQQQKYSTPEFLKAKDSFNLTSSDEKIEEFPTFNSYEKYLANRANYRYYGWQAILLLGGKNGNIRSNYVMTNRLNTGYLGWGYRKDVEEKTWSFLHASGPDFNDGLVDEVMLGDIFKPKGQKTTLPMQIANTTNIDNYKLVPFTPDRLRYWGVTEYTHYLGGKIFIEPTKTNAVYNDIPLASSTSASSGIPFLVGCSTFPALKKKDEHTNIKYYLHLQDGGILDQQAMHSAKVILNYHKEIKDSSKRIVIIVDASSSGIENNSHFKHERAGRLYNLWRVMAPFSTPDAQYGLTRERIKLFEKEYNCTVIYLGMEVLLDPNLNPGCLQMHPLPHKKKEVAKHFYNLYKEIRDDQFRFLDVSMCERKLLFSYIDLYLATWFASRGGDNGYVMTDKEESSAKIMFLAGRGVVQLKRDEIIKKMNGNTSRK